MEPIFEIKTENTGNDYAKFVISPLVGGYGHTLGTALKRVLLSSIPGAAITSVRIAGIKHQFSTLKGMREDILDFVLNLKKVRIENVDESNSPAELTLSVKKEGPVTAGDIKTNGKISIANPDLVLAYLAKGGSLDATLEVSAGTGYKVAEERSSETIGTIPVDAIFTPVLRVNYKIEETRVGRVTNYDKLILEVWTDGTISPHNALIKASNMLVSYFQQVVSPAKVVSPVASVIKVDSLGTVGKLSVEEIGLPTRVANALIKAGYDTVERLVVAPKNDLIRVRNLGEKSLKVIKAALSEKGVKWEDAK